MNLYHSDDLLLNWSFKAQFWQLSMHAYLLQVNASVDMRIEI